MQTSAEAYAHKILQLLKQHYPQAHMILEWSNNWELIVAIILSAQCTDITVNKVTSKLFPKYRNVLPYQRNPYEWDSETYAISKQEFNEIANYTTIPLSQLELDIKSTGFYKNKAKHIQGTAKILLEKYHGVLPKTIAELLTLPGVGRKTANVFLGNAYRVYEGIAVDTHVKKQAQLLGLIKQTTPDKIEQELMRLVNQKDWFQLTYLLIGHGRNMRRKKADRKVCGDEGCLLCKI